MEWVGERRAEPLTPAPPLGAWPVATPQAMQGPSPLPPGPAHILPVSPAVPSTSAAAAVVAVAPSLRETVAQQVDGHPDVALKSAAHSKGHVLAMVPNGHVLKVLAEHNDYVHVRWNDTEGYVRMENTTMIPRVVAMVASPLPVCCNTLGCTPKNAGVS